MQSGETYWIPGSNEPDGGGAKYKNLRPATRAALAAAPSSPAAMELSSAVKDFSGPRLAEWKTMRRVTGGMALIALTFPRPMQTDSV